MKLTLKELKQIIREEFVDSSIANITSTKKLINRLYDFVAKSLKRQIADLEDTGEFEQADELYDNFDNHVIVNMIDLVKQSRPQKIDMANLY